MMINLSVREGFVIRKRPVQFAPGHGVIPASHEDALCSRTLLPRVALLRLRTRSRCGSQRPSVEDGELRQRSALGAASEPREDREGSGGKAELRLQQHHLRE